MNARLQAKLEAYLDNTITQVLDGKAGGFKAQVIIGMNGDLGVTLIVTDPNPVLEGTKHYMDSVEYLVRTHLCGHPCNLPPGTRVYIGFRFPNGMKMDNSG